VVGLNLVLHVYLGSFARVSCSRSLADMSFSGAGEYIRRAGLELQDCADAVDAVAVGPQRMSAA
jgi:hypothetical protein